MNEMKYWNNFLSQISMTKNVLVTFLYIVWYIYNEIPTMYRRVICYINSYLHIIAYCQIQTKQSKPQGMKVTQ
jgi:hypothetical protein